MNCIAPRCVTPRAPGSLFCRVHEQASAGQRGGWISAEKRRRALASSSEVTLDASNITKRLWIGSVPPFDRDLPFDALALCAVEIQPERLGFSRSVIRVPINDSQLTGNELGRVMEGARAVANKLAGGKRVLVTCAKGLNRSSLVAGIALGMTTRLTPEQIVTLIRSRRSPKALGNHHFVDYISKICTPRR